MSEPYIPIGKKGFLEWHRAGGYSTAPCPLKEEFKCVNLCEDGTCILDRAKDCAVYDPRVYGLTKTVPMTQEERARWPDRKPYDGGWNGRMIYLWKEYHERKQAEKSNGWKNHPEIWDRWADSILKQDETYRSSDHLAICKPVIVRLEYEWWKMLCDVQYKTMPGSGNDSWTDHRYVVWHYDTMQGFNDNYRAACAYYSGLEQRKDQDLLS